MTLKQIAALGRKLVAFLGLFADCFGRREARGLLRIYVQGQLSDVHRKTAEGIALEFGKAPRTLQRFLETIKWDAEEFHDRCQQIVAQEHSHPEAIGVVDDSGTSKSGHDTVPAIVLCPGTAGTKSGTGGRIARIFAQNGYVVLAFDYRGWGDSDSKLITLEKQPRPDAKGKSR